MEATAGLLERCLPDPELRLQVSAAVMDMSAAFAAAVRQTLPSAVIVYDRFHVSKLLNTAVDQVRRAEHKRLSARGDSTLKNTRCHWLTGPENLEPQKLEELEALFARNAVVARAWTDQENFASFWDCGTEEEAMALRFRIILDCAGGLTNTQVAAKLSVAMPPSASGEQGLPGNACWPVRCPAARPAPQNHRRQSGAVVTRTLESTPANATTGAPAPWPKPSA